MITNIKVSKSNERFTFSDHHNFKFKPGLNLILGANTCGKTSLLNIIKQFNNRVEYYNDLNDYCLKKVVLRSKYKDYDLLYPQGGGFFFSERIIDAMKQENVVGYDIIKGGCFYEEIDFA